MNLITFSPLAIGQSKIEGYRENLIEWYKDHSFDYTNGMTTGELNGKVLVHKDERYHSFFEQVVKKTKEYLDQFYFDHTMFDFNITKTWYALCDKQFDIPFHYHSCSHISFVYYLDVQSNDPLIFQVDNPNEWFGDAFSFTKEKTNLNSWRYGVQPQNEDILFFPGKIKHGTITSRDYVRMSIAGDILLTLKENILDYESGMLPTNYWKTY
jgi:hypothetical protein